jgi:ditrans,polycis-polyprenyl diphosphate synthase
MAEWLAQFPITQYMLELGKKQVCNALKTGPVPQHVGFIMDGNRTYAKKKHIELKEGHSAGFESMAKILEVCYDCGVKCATVFAFSIENFKRPSYEIQWLMELAKTKFTQVVGNGEMCEQFGIKIRILGDLDLLPDDVRKVLLQAEEITKNNNRAVLNVCWSYTSRDDMAHSIREIVDQFAHSKLGIQDIDEYCISKNLYTGQSPELDLLIRTSGVYRLSDFMLWESVSNNCDIEIVDVLWPQFNALRMVWLLIKWSFNRTYNAKFNNNSDNSNNNGNSKIKIL